MYLNYVYDFGITELYSLGLSFPLSLVLAFNAVLPEDSLRGGGEAAGDLFACLVFPHTLG